MLNDFILSERKTHRSEKDHSENEIKIKPKVMPKPILSDGKKKKGPKTLPKPKMVPKVNVHFRKTVELDSAGTLV